MYDISWIWPYFSEKRKINKSQTHTSWILSWARAGLPRRQLLQMYVRHIMATRWHWQGGQHGKHWASVPVVGLPGANSGQFPAEQQWGVLVWVVRGCHRGKTGQERVGWSVIQVWEGVGMAKKDATGSYPPSHAWKPYAELRESIPAIEQVQI